jgi:hypothetical protein
MFQKLEFQHSRRPKFEPGEADIEADPVKQRVNADGLKARDAGAAENQFLKHVRYNKADRIAKNFTLVFLLCVHSILFSQEVNPPPKLLILGCGRSGTNYMAELLATAGLDVLHERAGGRDGLVSWPMLFNSYSPWGPIEKDLEYQHIFHQVRNPLHVITSWKVNLPDLNRDEWHFIRKHIPQISKNDSLLVHCAKYWYYWNKRIEKKAEWRYRIEDIEEIFPLLQEKLDVALYAEAINEVPRNFNSWEPTTEKITWKKLYYALPRELFNKIQSMAVRYGYSIED